MNRAKNIIGFCLLMVIVFTLSSCNNESRKMKDDFIIIEAESADNGFQNSLWNPDTVYGGYNHSGYVHFTGDSEYPEESRPYESEDKNRVLSYEFYVNTPGIYYVKVFNRHFKEDGDNDCWISVNQRDWVKTYDHNQNEWTWDETGDWNSYELDKGVNKVELAGRSFNFMVDRIVVFHENHAPEPFNDVQKAVWFNK